MSHKDQAPDHSHNKPSQNTDRRPQQTTEAHSQNQQKLHPKQHHNSKYPQKSQHEKSQHEKPQQERHQQDKPQQEKTQQDKPQQAKFQQDKHQPHDKRSHERQQPHDKQHNTQQRSESSRSEHSRSESPRSEHQRSHSPHPGRQERPHQHDKRGQGQQNDQRYDSRNDQRHDNRGEQRNDHHQRGDHRHDNRNDQRGERNERNESHSETRPRFNRQPYTPEFIPTHSGIDRPEQLEELHKRGIPAPLRYDDPPYVPDKPAKGSDDIFYKDFNPLYTTARGLAIKILSRLDQSDSYLDKLLEYELAHCDLKPVDRALLTELVHGVTRWQARLDWILTGFYHGEFVKCIVPVKNAMRIALYQIMFLQRIPPFAAVSESVEFIKRLKGARSGNLVNAILRNILNNLNNIRYPMRHDDVARHFSIIHSHPFWLVKRWLDRFGEEDSEALLRINNERPKIALRMNMMRCNTEEFFTFLQTQDVKRWDAPYNSERFILVGSLSSVREWKPFRDGWFSVQDISASFVAQLANPKRGNRIYDLCAAPGGKATFLAELMNDEGTIIALDKYAGKLGIIQENAERLQLKSISTQAQDARHFAPKELADIVLLDAPCSGLGTLAKKPDIKWKFETTDFTPIVRTQREILKNAAKLVKPGGALVYSTCTIEPEENTEQVAWFLEHFPNFELDPAEAYLPAEVCKDGFLQTLPHKHQTDGAFAARFIRKQ